MPVLHFPSPLLLSILAPLALASASCSPAIVMEPSAGDVGVWDGRRVISEGWVKASMSSHTTVGNTDCGYLWWRPYLNVRGGRYDAVAAQGNGGQEIYLWPELDMVVVLTGANYNRPTPPAVRST